MPVDHFSIVIPSSKVDGMATFLTESLQHIGGFKEHLRFGPQMVGMGETGPYCWLFGVEMDASAMADVLKKYHVAFTAETNAQVRQFYDAARKAGAADNGAPGFRPQFGSGYYGAFVRDPLCGVNFEVVCHNQGGGSKL